MSKLHVLDLIVVSHYLPNNDILKFKFINSKFKDIQERILINYNPIVLNYTDSNDDYHAKKLKLLKYFPNIQTFCVDFNYPLKVYRSLKFDLDRLLSNIKFENVRLKLTICFYESLQKLIDLIDNYSNYGVYLDIYYFNRFQPINMIYKKSWYQIKINFDCYSCNGIFLNFDNITCQQCLKSIIINAQFEDSIETSEYHIKPIQPLKITFKNFNSIVQNVFQCENLTLYFENIHLIYYNSIKSLYPINVSFYQVKEIQPYAVNQYPNFINAGLIIPKNIKSFNINKQQLNLFRNILLEYDYPKLFNSIENIAESLIHNYKYILRYTDKSKNRNYEFQNHRNKFLIVRIFIDFVLLNIQDDTLKIQLNKIIIYNHNYHLDQHLKIELSINKSKIEYHNEMFMIWKSLKPIINKIKTYPIEYSFIKGFETHKSKFINNLQIGERYIIIYE